MSNTNLKVEDIKEVSEKKNSETGLVCTIGF